MNHAIGFKELFRTDIDRASFLDFLWTSTGSRFGVVAYCLMGNHFHLVVRATEPTDLSATMQTVCSRYARAHNRRNRTDGPVFRSRFLSKPVTDDAQLLVATRYVHRNPLELGIDICTYPWSSYRSYADAECAGHLEIDLVLGLAGGAADYRTFVESEHPADKFHLRDGVRVAPAPLCASPLDEFVVAASAIAGRAARVGRDAVLVVALDQGLGSADEVAEVLGLRSAAVARAMASKARVRIADDVALARVVAELRLLARPAA